MFDKVVRYCCRKLNPSLCPQTKAVSFVHASHLFLFKFLSILCKYLTDENHATTTKYKKKTNEMK